MWAWVEMKPPGYGPLLFVLVSIYQGSSLRTYFLTRMFSFRGWLVEGKGKASYFELKDMDLVEPRQAKRGGLGQLSGRGSGTLRDFRGLLEIPPGSEYEAVIEHQVFVVAQMWAKL